MYKPIILWLAATLLGHAALADPPHPRLWMPAAAEASVRRSIQSDPLAARLHQSILAEADRILKARTCRYEIPDGKRLLAESRLALHNISHCTWAWRIAGNESHRLRAIAELEAACSLKDWNPSHFLDTAEMATAVAMGYDWLHASLTPDQRSMCERALIEKALTPAKSIFDRKSGWAKPGNNWSQVCGAGIALAAAAIADKNPALSEPLFQQGLQLVESCSKFYQPDGMYPEGPGYWHYGTNFHVMMLAACKPMGRSFQDDPILRQAGASIMHLTSPTRINFNFADGKPGRETPSPAQCWIASHYADKAQARHVRDLFARALDESKGKFKGDRYAPLSILWLPADPGPCDLPHAAAFHGEQAMALFRTSWKPDAAWFAIKGGTAAASHGHMDVGCFVFDAHGERWIHDLGAENYNLPGYFGKQRWTYYRLQNRSHNTLEIAGRLQNPKSKPCPLLSTSRSGPILEAAFDLSDAYLDSAARVIRKCSFDTRSGAVMIADEIENPAGDVIWRAITDATPEIRGPEILLTKNKKSVTLRLRSAQGTWSVHNASPPTPAENPNTGFKVLALSIPAAAARDIRVEINP